MKGKRVVFVDDDDNVLRALERGLGREPFEIVTFNDASEALSYVDQTPVDVVVSDERMSGMSGTDFLIQVREKSPATFRILLTGHASLETALRAINDGEIYRLLTKPCERETLKAAIYQALKEKDFLDHARRLVSVANRQSSVLTRLEDEHPGITQVDTDHDGVIVIEEDDLADLDSVLDAMRVHTEV